ncbi:MAG: RHS repeat domain-containing protein [Methylococcales bacterium]
MLFAILLACAPARAQTRPVVDHEYDAQGNLTKATDALGRVTLMNYNALNRLRRTVQPAPGAGQSTLVIDSAYNPAGHLTAVTDPRLLATRYTTTGLGDLTQQDSPDTGTTLHTFDAAGNLKTRKDARNWTTRYSYDALNRVTQARYGGNSVIRFFYDEGGNGLGRLTRMVDPSPITTVWIDDNHGRVLSRGQTIGTGTASRTTGPLAIGEILRRALGGHDDRLGNIRQDPGLSPAPGLERDTNCL